MYEKYAKENTSEREKKREFFMSNQLPVRVQQQALVNWLCLMNKTALNMIQIYFSPKSVKSAELLC